MEDPSGFLVLAIGKALVFHKEAEERCSVTWQGIKCRLPCLTSRQAMHLGARLCHTQTWLCPGTGAQRGHQSWACLRKEGAGALRTGGREPTTLTSSLSLSVPSAWSHGPHPGGTVTWLRLCSKACPNLICDQLNPTWQDVAENAKAGRGWPSLSVATLHTGMTDWKAEAQGRLCLGRACWEHVCQASSPEQGLNADGCPKPARCGDQIPAPVCAAGSSGDPSCGRRTRGPVMCQKPRKSKVSGIPQSWQSCSFRQSWHLGHLAGEP